MAHSVVNTSFWHLLDDGRVQCDICPRYCKLRPGQRGLCFVRKNENDAIVLTTYGRSSGFCIDPIEKKPLNHFYPGSPVLSFGTAGCNLACKFCQNWDISKSRQIHTLASEALPETIAKVAAEHDCLSVAYTYNDPVIFHEYVIDVAKACRQRGLYNVAVSAGYQCAEPRAEFYQYIDAANIDLKAFDERFYYKLTGGHLQPVLDTLQYLKHETSVWLEITTLVIPGHNDDKKSMQAQCEWIGKNLGCDVPLHLTAFHPDYKMLEVSPTPPKTLLALRDIALNVGLHFVYVGNLHHPTASSTYCPQCNSLLIERNWYQLGKWQLDKQGKCRSCGFQLPGRFGEAPGHWGPHRLPVVMRSA